ncbi:oxidoreductase [Paractinoplanes abujensis]|uniref:NADPH:quinone reductase-like Zn-dependent oxidoreductase n=1 Tax=Paractinoplanes abujensis TaxID=882441 RepID=A0A7W7G059_9ACTN|nr:NADP-dependent oxidoreductase [Actinoplanes abujensis]MBB4692783.1 NADPH:quinone reductase-like Zn-dependent oxidoreductase [Actinoplanes abujensis]GID22718.1 oxidoreductase [Actinoplanes abujensis]
MRAVRFHRYGEPGVLTLEDVAEPHAGPGEVRIRVVATSVNPIDWKVRAGHLAAAIPTTFPAIPGADAAGVVDEVGDQVTGVGAGDRVFGLTRAGAAEFAVLPFSARLPGPWSFEQGAAAGLVSVTAMAGLEALGDLDGRTLLVEGAAGGVGSAAVQIALARGARVVGRARAEHHDYLRTLGAVPVAYGETPGGIELALDTAGAGTLAELVALTGNAARVATVADYNAATLGVTLVEPLARASAHLAEVSWLGQAGDYTPRVEASYPLEKIADAHAHAERGHSQGKIVVVV